MKHCLALLLILPTLCFAHPLQNEKGSVYEAIENNFERSQKWEVSALEKTAIAGRCFSSGSSIPWGAVLLVNSIVVDSGPILGSKRVASGLVAASFTTNKFDNQSYDVLMSTLDQTEIDRVEEFRESDEYGLVSWNNMKFKYNPIDGYVYGMAQNYGYGCYFFQYN